MFRPSTYPENVSKKQRKTDTSDADDIASGCLPLIVGCLLAVAAFPLVCWCIANRG